jgi:DNA-directed RNA polymerase specialized sigma24 family protein
MPAMPEPQRPVLSDAELLQRLGRRDSTALIEVERRHWSSLYAQVYGMVVDPTLAERVVREVFAQLWFAAERFPLRHSLWSWLRDMARELARAEHALAQSPDCEDSSSIRRLHETSATVDPGAAAAGSHGRAGADHSEPPGLRYREGESGGGESPPRDACAW